MPQAKLDFSNAPQHELEAFLRSINMNTVSAARALLAARTASPRHAKKLLAETFLHYGAGWKERVHARTL